MIIDVLDKVIDTIVLDNEDYSDEVIESYKISLHDIYALPDGGVKNNILQNSKNIIKENSKNDEC